MSVRLKGMRSSIPVQSKVVKASLWSRIARKSTLQPILKFSQLIYSGESRQDQIFFKKILMTDFEQLIHLTIFFLLCMNVKSESISYS